MPKVNLAPIDDRVNIPAPIRDAYYVLGLSIALGSNRELDPMYEEIGRHITGLAIRIEELEDKSADLHERLLSEIQKVFRSLSVLQNFELTF
jgi:hypothetical protein